MKKLRNIAAIAIVALSLSACGGNSDNKSIGDSADTGQTMSNEGATSVGGLDTTATDSVTDTTTKGNADPTGRPQ
ncbi:hypothetical protein LLH06_20335 [Mucilaginibacter daejeonensis]|uniref:hypothetical protein n=1 Tax=Mucilaginibacter daejeonensis TaxID=398049 RepID=UPI001D17B525|nr:hypothetical protein [Mucilaginibacter daejeonensis]UEG53288.1 hypothetical protein LLH06_20335 [Mucilaginibacter daejeonensis]